MIRGSVVALLIGLGVYALIVAYMFFNQRQLLYHPDAKRVDPTTIGITGAEVTTIATPDGEKLVAWYAPAAAGQPTVLFLHGNAGSIAERPLRFQYYRKTGFGVLYLSWRGYGGSTGQPSEHGLLVDANAAYDWLMGKGVSPDKLVVVGESLGTGPAVQLAAAHPVAALALEAPYTTMVDVARYHYGWLPVQLLLLDRFDSLDTIAKVHAPLIIIHGDADPIIPFALGKRLFDAAPEPKRFVAIPGGTHGSIFEEPTWAQEVAFFLTVLKEREG
jgi:fermentation-respiration switch protein FrsA (DUF1100 family)